MSELHEFEYTALWKNTLARQTKDKFESQREALRVGYLDFRDRVSHIVNQIPKDVPGLTVHDITHLDALWETASLITGEDFALNPAEAFVLGGAILLHDAGMCIASYEGGLEEIALTPQWGDAITQICRRHKQERKKGDDIESLSSEIKREANSIVLRALHSNQAEKLAFVKWGGTENNSAEYLIQNSDLRDFYGPIIGEIAASHWWAVNDLQKLQNEVTAGPGVPSEWVVDPIKIASILRVADAAHIDHRRAPRFLRMIEKPEGISADHWNFQNKLGKPSRRGDMLIYASGTGFEVKDAESWWLCFDAVKMIDHELHQVDTLLQDLNKPRFVVNRVQGADYPSRLAESIRTNGWTPIDARVKVSNVPALARMLGGEKLYGSDPLVVIRELIQNAADAIRARRLYARMADDFGEVIVELRKQDDNYWLDFTDNGIGMSKNVLTNELLDFGSSFWSGDGVRKEFPGLLSMGMESTGKFGIGFFSAFMLGETICVTSRRYDSGIKDTHTLEFLKGLDLRPTLRDPIKNEFLGEPGTRVSILLSEKPDSDDWFLNVNSYHTKTSVLLKDVVAAICPTVDVNVSVIESGVRSQVITCNDWMEIGLNELASRVNFGRKIKKQPDTLSNFVDQNGNVLGRATVATLTSSYMWDNAVLTIGGFRANTSRHLQGVILGGAAETVLRDQTEPQIQLKEVRDWANIQEKIILGSKLEDYTKIYTSSKILGCCGSLSEEFPIGFLDQDPITISDLKKILRGTDQLIICDDSDLSYDSSMDEVRESEFDDEFEINPEILLLPESSRHLVAQWPRNLDGYDELDLPKTPVELVRKIATEVWDETEEDDEWVEAGRVLDDFIERHLTVFKKTDQEI